MKRKLLIASATFALLYCALQPTTYHNHRTGNRVVTVQCNCQPVKPATMPDPSTAE